MVLSEDGAGSKVRSRDGNLADFFEPTANGVARTPEGARKTSEARALLVSVQDLLTSLWRIGVRAGILAALPAAIMAEVLLFAIWSFAVLDDVFAFAVIAGDDLSNHSSILSFGLEPLPVLSRVPGHGALGSECRLTKHQQQRLVERAAQGELRTYEEARRWVKEAWGVEYRYKGIYAVLSRLGVSPKVPRPTAEKGDPKARKAWKKGGS